MTFPQPAPIDPAAERSAHLRRALLRAARDDAPVQDLIDAAELLIADGRTDAAAMLYGVLVLQIGASRDAMALFEAVDRRTGLWPELRSGEPAAATGGFCVDLAIGELRGLMRDGPELASADPAPVETAADDDRSEPALLARAGAVAVRLRDLPVRAAAGELGAALRSVAAACLALPPVRIEEQLALASHELVPLLAVARTRRFLVTNADLLQATPAGLFDAAARLRPGGLGPYLTNVAFLPRNVRDVFAMIDVAAGGRAGAAQVETWSLLLATHLRSDQRVGVAAELGDRGLVGALGRMLAVAERIGGYRQEADLVRGIRDAALDLDAFPLAVEAQSLLAAWHPADAGERRRLGEIRFLSGDLEGAEQAFDEAISLGADRLAGEQKARLRIGKPIVVENVVAARRVVRQARLKAFKAAADLT